MKELIATNKTKQVFDKILHSNEFTLDSSKQSLAEELYNHYKQLERDNKFGIIGSHESDQIRNRIIFGLLSLINDLNIQTPQPGATSSFRHLKEPVSEATELLEGGKLHESLKLLTQIPAGSMPLVQEDHLILIRARVHRLRTEELSGLLTGSEIHTRSNHIKKSLMDLLTALQRLF